MKIPKVKNIIGHSGKEVKNQFIIETEGVIIFQSYGSVVCMNKNGKMYLDEIYWDYSSTTGKYRNIFLGESKQETEKKIETKEYELTNLNK